MSPHNIGFYEDLTKIIFELSSNTHFISSAAFANSLNQDQALGIQNKLPSMQRVNFYQRVSRSPARITAQVFFSVVFKVQCLNFSLFDFDQ